MVRVLVALEGKNDAPVEYELNPQVELPAHVELLSDMLKIKPDERHKYGLRLDKKPLQENAAQQIPTGSVLLLGLKPKYEAMNVLQKLIDQRDPVQLKTTFFYLRKNLAEVMKYFYSDSDQKPIFIFFKGP
jgi:hypothetical protein